MKTWNTESSSQELQLLKQHLVLTRDKTKNTEVMEGLENALINLIKEGQLTGTLFSGEREVKFIKV